MSSRTRLTRTLLENLKPRARRVRDTLRALSPWYRYTNVLLSEYKPQAQLVVKETPVEAPRFPVVDAHIHLGSKFGGRWLERPFDELLEALDAANVRTVVDLDGGWGESILDTHLRHFKERAPERFVHFGGVDWSQWLEHGDRFGEWAAGRLRAQVARGAQGLKIWKPLGLHVKDQHSKLVAVDDERLTSLWHTAADLEIPVTIHIADPVAFFQPFDARNERWEELRGEPGDRFTGRGFPTFEAIIEAFANLVRRHPDTTFIGAHMGCYAENLAWVGALLDECPNFNVDISARLGELGRQPYSARRFFIRYQDRILFGTDADASPPSYRHYYRLLETDDEYVNYSRSDVPTQGRWYAYGLYLPDEVLQKVYAKNAERLILKVR